jgi:hypothetical protein
MARLLLSLCFLLVACADRDLRPERFACDAGGPCPGGGSDAGAVDCPFGNTCTCREEDFCDFRCMGQCAVDCLEGSDCAADCNVGSCRMTCHPGAECNFSCNTSDCTFFCEEGSVCSIECVVSQCNCFGPACPI